MKKLLLLFIGCFFLLGFNPEARASHLAGGEIWYEYAGNAQNPHRYDVYLIIYRDSTGVQCVRVIVLHQFALPPVALGPLI